MMTGLTPFDASLTIRIHKWAGLYDREKVESKTYLRINLGETPEYASIQKTIHHRYTLTKWT